MVTNLRRILLLSSSILMASGFASDCFAGSETASNVLNNLLTTAAGSISQQDQQPAQVQSAAQAQGAAPAVAATETSTDAGETALPIFDEPGQESTSGTTSVASVTPTSGQNISTNVSATQGSTTGSIPAGSVPVASSDAIPATPVAEQALPASKKIGFIDKTGNILIAPEEFNFPAEMEDGKVYFFSRDVDAFKQKVASGEQPAPFSEKSNPDPTTQSAQAQNTKNGEWLLVSENGQAPVSQTASNAASANQEAVSNPQAGQPILGQDGGQGAVSSQGSTQQSIAPQNGQINASQAAPDAVSTTEGQAKREQALINSNKKPITFMCYVAESPSTAPAQVSPVPAVTPASATPAPAASASQAVPAA